MCAQATTLEAYSKWKCSPITVYPAAYAERRSEKDMATNITAYTVAMIPILPIP